MLWEDNGLQVGLTDCLRIHMDQANSSSFLYEGQVLLFLFLLFFSEIRYCRTFINQKDELLKTIFPKINQDIISTLVTHDSNKHRQTVNQDYDN